MFATPQDFINKYKQREYDELFYGSDNDCQDALDEAWGQMQVYLHRYVELEPIHTPPLPYELTLRGYQLTIARYLASERVAPREQVCEAYKAVIAQLKDIAAEKLNLPIYNPAETPEIVSPITAVAKVVQRTAPAGSFSSFARRCW